MDYYFIGYIIATLIVAIIFNAFGREWSYRRFVKRAKKSLEDSINYINTSYGELTRRIEKLDPRKFEVRYLNSSDMLERLNREDHFLTYIRGDGSIKLFEENRIVNLYGLSVMTEEDSMLIVMIPKNPTALSNFYRMLVSQVLQIGGDHVS